MASLPSTALQRRRLIALGAAAAVWSAAPAVFGQAPAAFPQRQVRIVTPFPPGGVIDAGARLVAARLEERWKQPVLVENRPGGAGALAASHVMQSAPDGHTLLMPSNSMLLTPLLEPQASFDLRRDFLPLSLVGESAQLLLVSNGMGVRSVGELEAALKAQPAKFNYGTIGVGSALHLYGDQLARRMQARPVPVPQKGGAAIVNEMLADRLDYSFMDLLSPRGFIENGKLHAVAITGTRRSPLYPTVPTLQESGVAGFETMAWFGFFAPAKTPPALVTQLSADLGAVLRLPEVLARLAQTGTVARPTTPDEFARLLASDAQAWARMVKEANLAP